MNGHAITANRANLKKEFKIFGWMLAVFGLAYFLPLSDPKVRDAIQEAFQLLQWYVRNHTLACVVLTAMGPTYLWFQLQTLREVVAGFGLTDAEVVPAMKRMACGATRTLLESGLSPAEVIDLIPVKPLADMEPQVAEMYRTRLPGIYQKIQA